MSSVQGLFRFIMDQNSNRAAERCQERCRETQNWLLDKHHRSDHLTLDILKPATGATCKLSSSSSTRVPLPYSSHRGKGPEPWRVGRMLRSLQQLRGDGGETHLDLPLSKESTREGGCCRTTEDYSSYRRTVSHSYVTQGCRERAGSFPTSPSD